MGQSVSINGKQVKLSAIVALKPFDETIIDPSEVKRHVELQAVASIYNGRPVIARRTLNRLADELGFPVFQSHHPVALNPHFGHYKIETYDPEHHGSVRLAGAQTIISWKSEYGYHAIPLLHPVDEVMRQLPKLAQRAEIAPKRPPLAVTKPACPSADA